MKKKLIFVAALFCGSTALAGGPEMIVVAPSPFNGFYVGGSGSFHQTGFTIDSQTNFVVQDVPSGATSTFVLQTTSGGDTQTDGYYGVRGGWGRVFANRWYAGIEGFGEFGTAKGNVTTTYFPDTPFAIVQDNDAQVDDDWGVAARLGILLSPTTLGYAKLGAEWAKVKSSIEQTAMDGTTVLVNQSTSNTESGFLWGFGVEQFVFKDIVSLFAEYTYTSLGGVTDTSVVNLNDDHDHYHPEHLFSLTFSNNSTPEISALTGGLNVHFGQNWL